MELKEVYLYKSNIERTIKSLVNVYVERKDLDLLLKFITFLNLGKKLIRDKIPLIKLKIPLTAWPFRDCIGKFKFLGNTYNFCLPKGYDFNNYLNPYFHEYDVTRFVSLSH